MAKSPMPPLPDPDDMFADTRMSFGDHIEELRGHILRAVYGFLIAMVVCILPPVGPWAVKFTDVEAYKLVGVPLEKPLHPTQLYEAFAEALIFAILYWRIGKPHSRGTIIALYLMLYPAARFVVEFFRSHEQANPFGWSLSIAQWVALGLVAAGAGLFIARQRTARTA